MPLLCVNFLDGIDIAVVAVNQHIKRIFADGKLTPNSIIKDCLITAADGKNYKKTQSGKI